MTGDCMLDNLDKKIIATVQEEFPLIETPYRLLAEQLQISEDELLQRLRRYKEGGQLRKMGAVLRHREVGYSANALCAWVVPYERHDEVGAIMIKHPVVTHCYGRLSPPDWPYTFYTMIHAKSREECHIIAAALAHETGLDEYVLLFSTKEWKKTSMKYFKDEIGE